MTNVLVSALALTVLLSACPEDCAEVEPVDAIASDINSAMTRKTCPARVLPEYFPIWFHPFAFTSSVFAPMQATKRVQLNRPMSAAGACEVLLHQGIYVEGGVERLA